MKAFNPDLLRQPIARYAAASLSPLLALTLGAFLGGGWALFGFLWITLFLFLGDRLARRLGLQVGTEPRSPASDRLALTIAALHFPALLLAIFALSGATDLGFWPWVFTFFSFGLWFGQVSNATAHELIHRQSRPQRRLGMWVYISLLYGHHTSAHRLVHHRFVATPDDPNTSALGEGFYAFLLRAWPGEFIAGYEMENGRRAAKQKPGLHPYTVYLAGGALCVLIAGFLAGVAGVAAYLLICAHTHVQLLLCDYVQHYGLVRRKSGPDSYEPFGPEHAWDAPDLFSGLMMLQAPRHADHHAHPQRPFTELTLSPGGRAPLLPASLPAMATLALIPSLWRKVMDPRADRARARSAQMQA